LDNNQNIGMDFQGNQTGVLIELVGSTDNATRCVPAEVAPLMINGPGFYGRAVCLDVCP
jgi:hypothetical protein